MLSIILIASLVLLLIVYSSDAFQLNTAPLTVSRMQHGSRLSPAFAAAKKASITAEAAFPRASSVPVNNAGNVHYPQRTRPRRNRKSAAMRSMIRETIITPANFIYPLFIHDEAHGSVSIDSMPGCERHSLVSMLAEVKDAMRYGVNSFVLFPKVPYHLKTNLGEESYNPDGLVPRAIRMIKEACGSAAIVVTDIALDPYSSMGHDGVFMDNEIMNDLTISQLCRQALCQARAGADIVAPSDMMDGRIGAIRDALDDNGFTNVSILAYTAKYASAYYGPFRDALGSHPGFGDKKTYQQDPANGKDALIEMMLDESEGADMLMVKPGLPYLDIIRKLKDNTNLPISAYHVSGEYCMIKAASERGWLNEREVVLETLTCMKRAGADVILTYYAKQAAMWLKEDADKVYNPKL
jgi:porphobilinogen synthase